jgi:hypothetical protein
MMWEDLLLHAFCAACALVAFVVAVWAVVSGAIADDGIDGIFLLLVCLLVAVTFAMIPAQAVRTGKWRHWFGRKGPTPPVEPTKAASAVAGKPQERTSDAG